MNQVLGDKEEKQTQNHQQTLPINFKFYNDQKSSQIAERHGLNICQPAITNMTRFSFQILETGYGVWVGICKKIKQPDFTKIGHGCYLIYHDGCCLSHHQQELHLKYKSFEFTKHSIIEVEVNKSITFRRKDFNKQFVNSIVQQSMEIEEQEYYPCVFLGLMAKVKIFQ